MTTNEKIRAEIERQKEINKKLLDGQLKDGCLYALNQILSFLDTLSEEPDKSLEEAANEYAGDSTGFIDMTAYRAFIAGAEWQASQMPMPKDTVLFQKGVAEGRRLEREDMLKEAVEGEVYLYYSYKRKSTAILVDIPIEDLGDKVRIVVLKEEDENG